MPAAVVSFLGLRVVPSGGSSFFFDTLFALLARVAGAGRRCSSHCSSCLLASAPSWRGCGLCCRACLVLLCVSCSVSRAVLCRSMWSWQSDLPAVGFLSRCFVSRLVSVFFAVFACGSSCFACAGGCRRRVRHARSILFPYLLIRFLFHMNDIFPLLRPSRASLRFAVSL